MINLPKSIEQKFYDFIYGDISLDDFESWVYTENNLEAVLPADDYLDLISYNFKKNGAKNELTELLFRRVVDRAEYEKWKILKMLYIAQEGDERLPDVLRQFYDLYCRDYNFLRDLGLGYGLMLEVPPSKYKADTWEEMSKSEKEEFIESLYPQLKNDIQRAIDWIEDDRIIFKGTVNLMGYNEYDDLRTDEERKSTVWTVIEDNNIQGESSFRVEENLIANKLSEKPKNRFWSFLKNIWS